MLLAPYLDRDLLDRQGNRRLGLGRLHGDAVGAELTREAVGDHGAQALERLIGALLGDQGDDLADLAVVDRVLDAVGDQGVGLADVEADVEHQPLADLALGGGHAMVCVKRQPDDLDGDPYLGALFVVVVVVAQVVFVVVVLVGITRHWPNVAAVTASASAVAATSWTRNTRAPRS